MTDDYPSAAYYYCFVGTVSSLSVEQMQIVIYFFLCNRFIACNSSTFQPFHVPIFLSFHIPLGVSFSPVCLITPIKL